MGWVEWIGSTGRQASERRSTPHGPRPGAVRHPAWRSGSLLAPVLALSALLACGSGGGASSVAMPLPPPVIHAFTANPPSVTPGGTSVLSWVVSGGSAQRLDPGGIEVSGVTSRAVNPTATTTYTLTATGGGGTASAQVTVTMKPAPDFSAVTALLDSHPASYPNGVRVVVYQGDQEVYRHSIGALTDTTQKAIASATKWYSAAVVLRLAEQGKLGLDDPIGKHLPAFPRPGKGDLTIRQCFGMKSGLFLQDPEFETDPTLTLAQSVDRIAERTPVVFTPGSQLAYDGDGMQVVGRICETVTGKDWRTLARDELFTPLGMTDSDYGLLLLNPAVAGGARSTLADYQRFLRMVLQRGLTSSGTRYLSEASIETFFTNGTRGLPAYDTPWPASLPTAYGQRADYGFGSWIQAQNPQTLVVEEVSSPGKFGTWPWVDRKRNVRGVIFAADPSGYALGIVNNLQILQALRDALDR